MFQQNRSRSTRPTASQNEAAQHVQEGGVAIYWRPGCPFCAMLEQGLGEDVSGAVWVNIWEDDEALSHLESLNDGNATVPTVVTRARHFVAAAPREVAAAKELVAAATKKP